MPDQPDSPGSHGDQRPPSFGLGRIVIAPFLSLQYLTTREPDFGQAEVALTSLKTAMGTGDDEEPPEGQPVKESMEDNS